MPEHLQPLMRVGAAQWPARNKRKAVFAVCELWVPAGQGRSGYQQHASHHLSLHGWQMDAQIFTRLSGQASLATGLDGISSVRVQYIMAPAAWTAYLLTLVSIHQAVNPGSRQGRGHVDMWFLLLFWSGFNTDFPEECSLLSLRPWRIHICCFSRLSLGIISSINTCDASPEYESNFHLSMRENRGRIEGIIFQWLGLH